MRYQQFFGLITMVVLLMFLGIDSSVAETGKKPDADSVLRGKKLYRNYCLRCHGAKGVGEKPIPQFIRNPDFFQAPALNKSMHAWHHTDEALLKQVLEGSTRTKRMPALKNKITHKQAVDLVSYVKSLWGQRELDCQGPKHMSCKPAKKKIR